MTGPVLRARSLRVAYGARVVIDDLDLDAAAGEAVGVVGPSGCGKSTLLRVLAGLMEPAGGSVRIALDGRADALSPRAAQRAAPGAIAAVSQAPLASLDPLWSIERCVAEPLAARGQPRAARARAARELLAAVGLGAVAPGTRPTRLSVGQAQRVAVARALAARPRVLLADEPTSALDVTTAAGVARLLRGAADAGAALVVASHDRPLLDVLCDRIVMLEPRR